MKSAKATVEEQERTVLLRTTIDEPLLIRRLLQHEKELTEDFAQHFLAYIVKKVYFNGQASGTFVGDMLAPCMEKLLQVETKVYNPASFPKYFQSNINQQYSPNEMFMLCSAHLGTTIGPVRMARKCKRLNTPVACITIGSNSPLANLSDIVINKLCGSEESFVETRTYMASLLIAFLCIIETANQKELVSRQQCTYCQQYFTRLEDSVKQITKDIADQYKSHKKLLHTKMVACCIGAGPYYAAAQEGDLKIAEAVSIIALAYEQGESMHTGTTQIQEDAPLFPIAPDDAREKRISKPMRWCRLYSDYVILVANHSHLLGDSRALLCHLRDDPYCSVMEYIVPF